MPQDFVTVARSSATEPPEFLRHRHVSGAMMERHRRTYHPFDPFQAHGRDHRSPGVLPLRPLADDATRRGRYMAELPARSVICDEVGLLIAEDGARCLGIFLDRSRRPFRPGEVALLRERWPVFAAIHAGDLAARGPQRLAPNAPPEAGLVIPRGLWPDLSRRESEVVLPIPAGHPTTTIAARLGITVGIAKNHRRRIYHKLDITTARELFVQVFQSQSAAAWDGAPG